MPPSPSFLLVTLSRETGSSLAILRDVADTLMVTKQKGGENLECLCQAADQSLELRTYRPCGSQKFINCLCNLSHY